MKKMAKDAVGSFRVLLDHAYRSYEVSPQHVLKRIVLPLCEDVAEVVAEGTKNDAELVLQGFVSECEEAARRAERLG